MPNKDPYLQEAIAAAEHFAKINPHFRLSDVALIPQGINNRVLKGTFDGKPAIAKYFGDGFRWNVPAELRKQRELTALKRAGHTGLVPKVLAVDDRLILIEMIQGKTLEDLRQARGWDSAPAGIARAIGTAHRVLSDLHLTPTALQEIETKCFNGQYCEQN